MRMQKTFVTKYEDASGGGHIPFTNAKDFRQGELYSSSALASARGLAKLGTYMAQKGTAGGKTIMSAETWGKFHENVITAYDQLLSFKSHFSDGGVNHFLQVDPESTENL